MLDAALNGRPLSTRLLFAAVAVIGNLLGKITRNFFAGIRMPWTLANEEVWYRTHRLADSSSPPACFPPWRRSSAPAFRSIGSIGLAALVPVAYSYWIYRKLEGRPPATP